MGRYWSADALHYGNIVRDELASFRREAWMERFGELLPSASCVLDFRCGPGFFSIVLAALGHTVTGVDISTQMVEQARANVSTERLPLKPTFLHSEKDLAAFADASFDVIVSRNVTWTLSDPVGFYKEALRVLAPGGTLIVYDANWNLPAFDEALAQRCAEREAQCLARYGSTFDPAEIDAEPIDIKALPLSRVVRPAWDAETLPTLGFASVLTDETITETLWDEKEKLIYGETPLFEIVAKKA